MLDLFVIIMIYVITRMLHSAILNTSSVLIEHSCQIIITRVTSTCDPSVLTQRSVWVEYDVSINTYVC